MLPPTSNNLDNSKKYIIAAFVKNEAKQFRTTINFLKKLSFSPEGKPRIGRSSQKFLIIELLKPTPAITQYLHRRGKYGDKSDFGVRIGRTQQ
jgi:hypothetical protein